MENKSIAYICTFDVFSTEHKNTMLFALGRQNVDVEVVVVGNKLAYDLQKYFTLQTIDQRIENMVAAGIPRNRINIVETLEELNKKIVSKDAVLLCWKASKILRTSIIEIARLNGVQYKMLKDTFTAK